MGKFVNTIPEFDLPFDITRIHPDAQQTICDLWAYLFCGSARKTLDTVLVTGNFFTDTYKYYDPINVYVTSVIPNASEVSVLGTIYGAEATCDKVNFVTEYVSKDQLEKIRRGEECLQIL